MGEVGRGEKGMRAWGGGVCCWEFSFVGAQISVSECSRVGGAGLKASPLGSRALDGQYVKPSQVVRNSAFQPAPALVGANA